MNILDIVFPKVCVGCGGEGQYICEDCQKKLIKPVQICPMCCKPSLDGWTHPRCRRWGGMDRLVVGLPYRGMVQQCLKKVKYKSAWEMIEFLYQPIFFDETDNFIVTSVPMWRVKERERGFNQAEIIAKLVSENYKVPYLAILERTRETKPMYGLTRKKRQDNIEGSFKLLYQSTIKPSNQRVILVDDVWTTGATMRECAQVLKRAGASEVWGLTLAR